MALVDGCVDVGAIPGPQSIRDRRSVRRVEMGISPNLLCASYKIARIEAWSLCSLASQRVPTALPGTERLRADTSGGQGARRGVHVSAHRDTYWIPHTDHLKLPS